MLSPAENRVRFGKFEVDLRTCQLTKNGMKIRLPHQSIQVLLLLLERSGEIVTREDLRRHLWPSDVFVDFDHGLNKSVQKLRDALGDSADSPRYIETIPRIGYRFIVPPHVALTPIDGSPHEIVSSSDRAATAAPIPMSTGSRGSRTAVAVGIAVTLIAGVAVAWMMQRTSQTFARPIQSLAVLPLDNLSGDASEQYLADGMTDELITSLGQIGALRVISQTTAMQYKDAHKSLPQIARELNVGAVVLGSVMRSGDRIRITAQLFDADTDKQLWAQSYEGDLSGVWGLQNQVASAVAEHIRVKLTAQETTQLADTQNVNPAAYEALLKGNYFFRRNSQETTRKSLQYLQQAVKLDPTMARAWVGIARSYNYLGEGDVSPGEAAAAADSAVAKALELQPDLDEAYAERGWTLLFYHWDFPGAERDFRHALELNPGSEDAHEGIGDYFIVTGRFDQGIAEFERARVLDPLSPFLLSDYCLFLDYARRYDKALHQCLESLELDPTFQWGLWTTVHAYFDKGEFAKANEVLERTGDCNAACVAMLDETHGAPGKSGAFDSWLKSQKAPPDHFFLAMSYAGLGRKDQAFAELEKAYEVRAEPHGLTYVPIDPQFDSLRSDPRFDAFLRRAGLPPQPRAELLQYFSKN
jgi:TolB-like protein/DNA-binding winged helix-turn-helix (wHTH) protein